MIIGIDASRANSEQRTGVENYAFFVIQALMQELGDDEVRLYTREHLNDSWGALPERWSSRVLHMPFGRFWTQLRLSWEMFVRRPDVLFVPAHVMPLVSPKKTVVVIHDVAPMRFPESYSWFEKWYGIWSTRFALKRASTVVVPSEFTKQELVEFFPEAARAEIVVIPEAYDAQRFHPEVEVGDVLDTYGVTKPYVFFVGRIEEKKNVAQLVKAFEKLKEEKDIQLVLAGKPGFGYEVVAGAIAQSQYKDDILELGFVPDEDLPALYKDAEVFSFATQYEGFGIPVLEALAVGTPVVVQAGGAAQEVGGDAVIAVEDGAGNLANGILAAIEKNDAAQGAAHAQKFSWKKAAKELKKVL